MSTQTSLAGPPFGGGPTRKALLTRCSQRIALLPSFIGKVKNWPSVLAARLGGVALRQIEFRDGIRWTLYDTRPGLAIFREICLERLYDAPFKISPYGTVVDLGANIGIFTLLAAKTLVPSGRVIAFEPHPQLAAILVSNLVNNGISNVEFIEAAASTIDGQADLHLATTSMGATLLPDKRSLRSVAVQTVNLARFLDDAQQIELLKLDVEGAEWPIFFDLKPTTWKQVDKMVVEFHLDHACGRTPTDLMRRMTDLGYQIVRERQEGSWGYIWARKT